MFPGMDRNQSCYTHLQDHIAEVAARNHLQVVPKQVVHVIQLYEILKVRQGVILVGTSGGGKTVVLDVCALLFLFYFVFNGFVENVIYVFNGFFVKSKLKFKTENRVNSKLENYFD